MTFRPFHGLPELEEWLKTHTWVYYHAPMDHSPVVLSILRYTICNEDDKRQSKLTAVTSSGDRFTCSLLGHFERFKVKETK